jgi:hypothetical protein
MDAPMMFSCRRWTLGIGDTCFYAATINEQPGSWYVGAAAIKSFEIENRLDGVRCFVRFADGKGVYYTQVFKTREAADAVAAQLNEEGAC